MGVKVIQTSASPQVVGFFKHTLVKLAIWAQGNGSCARDGWSKPLEQTTRTVAHQDRDNSNELSQGIGDKGFFAAPFLTDTAFVQTIPALFKGVVQFQPGAVDQLFGDVMQRQYLGRREARAICA